MRRSLQVDPQCSMFVFGQSRWRRKLRSRLQINAPRNARHWSEGEMAMVMLVQRFYQRKARSTKGSVDHAVGDSGASDHVDRPSRQMVAVRHSADGAVVSHCAVHAADRSECGNQSRGADGVRRKGASGCWCSERSQCSKACKPSYHLGGFSVKDRPVNPRSESKVPLFEIGTERTRSQTCLSVVEPDNVAEGSRADRLSPALVTSIRSWSVRRPLRAPLAAMSRAMPAAD